ncbi:MAG: hypothetical protein AUG89_01615 [Acidobacteria bacterium 13_1_20CM_4_56_7]|nr:MAG: hypothetical protein AUG89_01615 [Acidobacteria bacterium 13_1_20CM_4_56_7]
MISMPRNINSVMGFPPFRGAVRQIILASVAIYILILLLLAFAPAAGQTLVALGALSPKAIGHGWLWQFATYAFVYVDPIDFVLSMLGIYFPILMVFYLFNRGAPIMLFPIPIQIPVKWIVLFTAAIEVAYVLLSHFALFYCVLLLGLGAGYIWYSLFLTRRSKLQISERYFALRNSYYRWKRRRAARKFEVYMRDHNRTVTFDEHGNYIPPEEDKKNGGSKSGWVN